MVQGYGAVGRHVANFLAEAGATIVAVADSRGAILNPDGIDLKRLEELKGEGEGVTAYAQAESISADDLIGVECDVWIPAARPDVINEDNVEQLRTKMVAQGANIPCTLAAEKSLYQRGVLCLPDFIVNAGGVICAAMEYHGASQTRAMARIERTLRENTNHILTRSAQQQIPHREAAVAFARERLTRIMATKRWSIF